ATVVPGKHKSLKVNLLRRETAQYMKRYIALLPLAVAMALTSRTIAQNPANHSPNQLNAPVFSALSNYHRGHSQAALLGLQQAAGKRRQTLAALMVSDPGAVLAAALPDDVLADVPGEARGLLEHSVTLQGQAEVIVEMPGTPDHQHAMI